LITIDTLRADRVGAYGDTKARTPTMDNLAATGVLFREAHAVTPLTLPSHATLLTGLLPREHGLRDNAGFRLEEDVHTLAEALRIQGYQTGAFVSAYVLDGAWGLDQGFQVYRDPFHPEDVSRVGAFGEVELPGAEVVNAATAWWEATEGPRFGWVHLYDPHTPWLEHPDWTGDPYRGEVHYADQVLSRLVSQAGPDSLILLTSDHGESLWEHGEREHGVLLSRSVTRVPLIIRPPTAMSGIAPTESIAGQQPPVARPEGVDSMLDLGPVADAPRASRVIETPVSGLDIAPTIADYAGASIKSSGRSLRPAMDGHSIESRPVYAETFFPLYHHGWSALSMAQDNRLRLERGARDVWIDWQADPFGQVDLGTGTESLAAAVEAGRGSVRTTPEPIDSQTAEALEALGYLTQEAPDTDESLDPRDQIGALTRLATAEAMDAPLAAIPLLEALVADHPDMVDARLSLAFQRWLSGDAPRAYTETLAVIERWPAHPMALFNGATLALELGEQDRTLELASRMLEINARDPRGFRLQAAVWTQREDPGQVKLVTHEGLQIAPEDPNLLYLHGMALKIMGEPLSAIPFLEKSAKYGSKAGDIPVQIAHSYQLAGRIDEAAQAYLKAAEKQPEDPRPRAMGGLMLAEAGRCEEATELLAPLVPYKQRLEPRLQAAMKGCKL
jgi:arylsulfatase A-like enzyme